MDFGRISVRGAELSSNFKDKVPFPGSSSVGMALRVEFITDWRRAIAFRGSRFPRKFNGVLTPSLPGAEIRPINLFVAPIRRTFSGRLARTGICRLPRIRRYYGNLRSNGNSALWSR